LTVVEEELAKLRQQRGAPPGEDASALQTQLEHAVQQKDQLLSERGQCEQHCISLGSSNPAAELELAQAQLEDALRERERLEQEGRALLLLQERFHQAQTELANRYSEPLRMAMNPYLELLVGEPQQALLSFDPQAGFNKLQLLQQQEAYDFDRLSGGMREQMAGALRLAMAEVLQGAYDGVLPLVFDDAFTNTDRDRLQLLQRMLERGMEQGVQIVLLSCHPEDYRSSWFEQGATAGTSAQKNPPELIGGIERVEQRLTR